MREAAQPLLEGRSLCCEKGGRVLFRHLHLRVHAGQLLRVEGANGSGKSCLLRILCGLDQPAAESGGLLLWRGKPLAEVRSAYYGQLRYLGHSAGISLALSPRRNLQWLRTLHGSAPGSGDPLAYFRLEEEADRPCRLLSAGQRRRAALAQLCLGGALLWILDEPFAALDEAGRQLLRTLLDKHLESGGAVVLSSHGVLEEAGEADCIRLTG